MRVILILFLGLLISCGQPKDSKDNKILNDVMSYLPTGQHEAELIELKKSGRADELSKKLYQAAKKNWDWYVEESKKAKTLDRIIPYDKRLGLTEAEYEEFLKTVDDKGEYVKSDTELVTINQVENKITFQSKGQLEILNTVTFNLTEPTITVGNYKLNLVDTVNVTDDKNAFKSSWKGYRWHVAQNKNNGENLNSAPRPISVTIGKLSKNKKTYIRMHTVNATDFGPIDSQIQFEF